MSGLRAERPKLAQTLAYARRATCWSCGGSIGCRSLPHLIETVSTLEQRGIGFRSLTENLDTTTAGPPWRQSTTVVDTSETSARTPFRAIGSAPESCRFSNKPKPKSEKEAAFEALRRWLRHISSAILIMLAVG
jgi:hypothetical protein